MVLPTNSTRAVIMTTLTLNSQSIMQQMSTSSLHSRMRISKIMSKAGFISCATSLNSRSIGGLARNDRVGTLETLRSFHNIRNSSRSLSIFSRQMQILTEVNIVSGSYATHQQRRMFHQTFRLSVSPNKDTEDSSSKSSSPILNQLKPQNISIPKPLQLTKHENIYTLPNFLTLTRLVSAPLIGYFILHAQPVHALLLFSYAAITDLLDGWLARRYNSFTVVGSVIDPMADKTLMTIATVCLYMSGIFPWWLALIILGRDVGLAISAIYFRWISLPPPKTMRRYWDFSLPSAEVKPTEISKINTLLQLCLVGCAMVVPVLPEVLLHGAAWNLQGVFEGWQYLVAGTTVWSGLSYVGSKDAVKILSQEEGERRQEEIVKKLGG